MSEKATPQAEVPNPAPAPVEAPAPVVAAASAPTDSIFNADELAAITAAANGTLAPAKKADDYTPATAAAPVAPAAPETPAAAEKPAAPASEAPKPADAAPTEEPTPEKLGKFRVQAKDFKEAELLRHMKTMSAEEAYAKVYGTHAPPKPADAAPAADKSIPATDTPPAPAADPAVDAIKAEIAALEAQSDKAAEDMDTKTANKLNRQILAKEAELREITKAAAARAEAAEEAKQTQAATTFQQRAAESAKEVYAARPSLADKASADRVEFDAFAQLKASDPDYEAIFKSPRWPVLIYREFAEAKGWNKAPAPAPAPALPAPTPGASAAPRVTAATVLTPGETPGGSVALTEAQLIASLDTMDLSQLRALLPKTR